MKTYLHILVLASCVAFICTSPASEIQQSDEGSGDGPEIVINEVVEKNVDDNGDNTVDTSETSETNLLDMEMNPEENEIKVNEKIADAVENKLDAEKCKKCIRKHYRSRHGEFCSSCEMKNEHKGEKEDETTQSTKINQKNRCKKCARKNFKARNEEFCSERCSISEMDKPIEKKHHKKEHKKKIHNQKKQENIAENEEITEATVDAAESETNPKVADVKVVDESNEEVSETTTEQELESNEKTKNNKRKNQKQKNKEKKKHKNKIKKQKDEKEEETLLEIVESSDEESEEQTDAVKLGPLENLIKFLIKSNTYTH